MPTFPYDVFLSHSSKDKAVVRPLAERLRQDEVKVWFDEWEIKPGDSIPAKIEEGLESSRVLVLCMSANAFGSDWAQLESGTFRFRDPLNKERRFLPLRLDDAPIKGSLAQFLYVDWRERSDPEFDILGETIRGKDRRMSNEVTSPSSKIKSTGKSTAWTFIEDLAIDEYEKLNREALSPWALLRTSGGLSITAPNGMRWRYAGLEFDGTVRDMFWRVFLDPFIKDITNRTFERVREFCLARRIDPSLPIEETDRVLRHLVHRAFRRMTEIDRKLRGKGFPNSVTKYEPEEVCERLTAIVTRRHVAEKPH